MALAESSADDSLQRGLREVLAAIDSGRHSITSRNQLAQHLGLTRQAISGWSKVPVEHVNAIESVLRVPKTVQRPDIFLPPKPRKRRK